MSYPYSPHKRRPSGPLLPPGPASDRHPDIGGSSYRGRPPLDYARDYSGRYRSPPRTSSSYRPNYSRPLTPPHSARSLSPTPSLASGSGTPAGVNGSGLPPGKAAYTRFRERDPVEQPPPSSYRRYDRPLPPPRHAYPPPLPPPSRPDWRASYEHAPHRHASSHASSSAPSRSHSSVSATAGPSSRPAIPPPQTSGGLEYGDADEEEVQPKQEQVKVEQAEKAPRDQDTEPSARGPRTPPLPTAADKSDTVPDLELEAKDPPESSVKVEEESTAAESQVSPPEESAPAPGLTSTEQASEPAPAPAPTVQAAIEATPPAEEGEIDDASATQIGAEETTAKVSPELEAAQSTMAVEPTTSLSAPPSAVTPVDVASAPLSSESLQQSTQPIESEISETPQETPLPQDDAPKTESQDLASEPGQNASQPENGAVAEAAESVQETATVQTEAAQEQQQLGSMTQPSVLAEETSNSAMEVDEQPVPSQPLPDAAEESSVAQSAQEASAPSQEVHMQVEPAEPLAQEKDAIEAMLGAPLVLKKEEPGTPPKTFDELLQRSTQTSLAKEEAFIDAFMKTVPTQNMSMDRPKLADLTNGSKPHVTTYYLPPVYLHNHAILRPLLEADFNKANKHCQVKISELRGRYLELHLSWKNQCERRERDKYQHDHRPLPAGCPYTLEQLGWAPSTGGNTFQLGASQLMANIPPSPGQPATPSANTPSLLPGAPGGGRASRRSGGGLGLGHPFGDAVRSEAEFHEILKTLEDVDFLDPKSRAAKSAAVVPDMLLAEDPKRAVAAFDDENAKVQDPEAFYGISRPDVGRNDPAATEWSDQEVQTFMRRFAQHPKQFGKIKQDLPEKTVSQCVLFYYRSKRMIDFRSLSERKHAGGRKGKRNLLLENSSGSSSLFTEVQERSKGKGKKTGPHMIGADELGLSPPGTPQAGPSRELSTSAYKKRMSDSSVTSDFAAKVTDNIFWRQAKDRRSEAEATKLAKRKTTAEGKVTTPGQPPSESQLEAAEVLASLVGGPAESKGDIDMADALASTAASQLKSSQSEQPPPRMKRKLNPSSYWSHAEKDEFKKWLGVYGKDFPKIAQHIPNKSHNQCRNYWANHHTKLNLDAIAARATGEYDTSMQVDVESPSDYSQVETPAAEQPVDLPVPQLPQQPVMEDAPTRPALGTQRSNTSMQLRDLLNASENVAPDSAGNTPADWFGEDQSEGTGTEAVEEGQTEDGFEEGEMPTGTPMSQPSPQEYYRRPPYGARDSYFPQMPAAPYPSRPYHSSHPPASPWPPADAPYSSSYYTRPPAYYSREPLPPLPASSYRGDYDRRRSSMDYGLSPPVSAGGALADGYTRRPPMPPYDYPGPYRYPPSGLAPPSSGGHSRYERPL